MVSYDLFCFSIFFERPEILLQNISDFFFDKKSFQDRTLQFTTTSLNNEWLNPKGGVLPKFFLGACEEEIFTVFFSNLSDGWTTAARKLSRDSKSKSIQVRISNPNSSYPVYSYEIVENGKTKRLIQLLKEAKWDFFQTGTPLPYEKLSLYHSKNTKNKFNTLTILEYLAHEGIDFNSICSKKRPGVVFQTNSY